MFIKLKDSVCSSRVSISTQSADIIPKWHHISTKSADITKLYDIPPASKGIIFEGFSWQGENFLNTCMYISIMMHKEVGT